MVGVTGGEFGPRGFLDAYDAATGKQLIEWGWDEPDPAFMRAHLGEMERLPFDGVVFQPGAGVELPIPPGPDIRPPWYERLLSQPTSATPASARESHSVHRVPTCWTVHG